MSTTIGSIAAQISAPHAQLAVARVLAALGSQFDWNADTLDAVADAVAPLVTSLSGVPSVFDQDDAAVAFWQAVT